MIKQKATINVYSEMNPWIDFCIVLADEKEVKIANEIIKQAYVGWFSPDSQTDEPIIEYISGRLKEVCIDHEVYSKGLEEEDYE